MHEQFQLSSGELKGYYRQKYISAIVSNAKKAANAYVRHCLATQEGKMRHISELAITEQGTVQTMHIYGVKSELCGYAAKLVMKKLRERGWKG
jgi:hypothetical protein